MGSGEDGLPTKLKGKNAAGNTDYNDGFNNIESSPVDNGGELLKVKITLDKLLAKYMSTIMKDQEDLEMLNTSKPESYKGDPKDLERFLRYSENVWALEGHRCKKQITSMRYTANPSYRNENDKYGDSVK